MTTRITVDPSGHRIEVKLTDLEADGSTVTTECLEPGSLARVYYIHSTRSIAICEIDPKAAS